jgi:hypothetical protein
MKPHDIEDCLRRMGWPAPSLELRDRVLSSAVIESNPITWSDRLWYSRAWRLSIAGAALVIVVLDRLAAGPGQVSVAPTPQAVAQAEAITETGQQVGLPSDVAESLGQRALSEAAAPQSSSEQEAIALKALEAEGVGGGR